MKTISNVLALLFILSFSTQVEAQFLKKLKKAVTEAVEDKAIDKIADEVAEEAVDQLDKAFEEGEDAEADREVDERSSSDAEEMTEEQSAMMGKIGGLMDGIMKDVNTEPNYSFDVTVTMEIVDSKKEKNQMTQSYSVDAMLSDVQNTVSIFDFANEAFVILDNKKKKAQVMSMSWMKTMGMGAYDESSDKENEVAFKKTGQKKQIHGYECAEYEMTHDDGRMDCWIAEKTDFKFADYLMGFSKMFDTKAVMHPEFSDKGYMMSMTSYDKKGKFLNSMEVINISKKSKTIDMSEYKLEKMGGY